MRGALSDAIRRIILPRLIAARRASERANDMALVGYGRRVTEQDITSLLSHIATADHHLAEAALTVLALRGVSREDILLELFQPAARRLGELWLADGCSFADVTLAVGRLRRLMQSDAMPASREKPATVGGRILIACLPGEQHTLGAAIVEDFFRSAGWDSVTWSGQEQGALETVARTAPFDIIALSIGSDQALGALKTVAGRLRSVSSRHLMGVLAGGRALDRSATAAAFGVDAIVHDPRAAVPTAQSLLQSS